MKEDLKSTNAKGQAHGLWKIYWDHDHLFYKCVYINGKKNGFDELYLNTDGKITDKRYHL